MSRRELLQRPRSVVRLVKGVGVTLFRRKPVRTAAILVFLLSFSRAFSQDYTVAQWRHKDGLPSGTICSLAQTPDGFLWLGTADGLVRYDGFQFVAISMDLFGLPPLGPVRSLLARANGDLVAGSESGTLLRLKDGHAAMQSLGSSVLALYGPFHEGFLVETADARFTCVEERRAGIQDPFVCIPFAPLDTRSGSIARPESRALDKHLELSGGAKNLVRDFLRKSSLSGEISKVLRNSDDSSWVATTTNGLFLVADGKILKRFTASTGLSDDRVWDLLKDRDGDIWAGTQNGLNRVQAEAFVTRDAHGDLLRNNPKDLAAGSNDRLWVGSSSGLLSLQGKRKATQIERENVLAVQSDGRGNLAVLTDHAMQIISASGLRTSFRQPLGQTPLMAASREGLLWLYSTKFGLRTMDASGKLSQTIALPFRAEQKVTSIAAGTGRRIFLALSDGALLLHDDDEDHWIVAGQRIPAEKITYLSPQRDGTLWFATEAGLRFFDGRRILRWDKSSGLPGNRILWALPDRLGGIWIAYAFGLARISVNELGRQANGKTTKVRYDLYDAAEGLTGNPEVHGQTPVVLKDDGKLWMTVSGGLAMIDTSHLAPTLLPPLTHILGVTADGLNVSCDRRLQLKPLTRTLSITYTGISLSAPLKVRYRYRLDSFDEQWQNVAAMRSATYTNLRPGSYHFYVEASNGELWNGAGASLDFEVLPAYYQTLWFRALCGMTLILSLATLYHLRLKRNEKLLRVRYEDRLAERNRIAQDLHDHLIQEMVGVSFQLEIADVTTPDGTAAKRPVQRALELAQQAVGHGRATLGTLRQQPLMLAELQQTLRDTAKTNEASTPLHLTFSSNGLERALAPKSGEEILQIVREALRNAMHHSGSQEVSLHTDFSAGQFCIVLADRGRGIDKERLNNARAGHFGIRGMQERALRLGASLELQTDPASGTEWRLTVPGSLAYQKESSLPTARLTNALRAALDFWKSRS